MLDERATDLALTILAALALVLMLGAMGRMFVSAVETSESVALLRMQRDTYRDALRLVIAQLPFASDPALDQVADNPWRHPSAAHPGS